MKKFTLLLSALLMLSLSVMAQIKMYLHFNDGTRVEYIASRVDSITFDPQIQEPDDSETPDGPILPDYEDPTDKEDDPVKPDDSTDSSVNANGHDYVDLGLPSGTLWATMNVGADSPEDYGYYFAWGETEPKEEYDWSTYKWCEGNFYTQTKYCTDSDFGTVDNKTILELSDDAANANWGGSWRMPTIAEQDELRNECTWTWGQKNGVNGYTVTGPNSNSIFLPAAGYRSNSDFYDAGYLSSYWSISLSTTCYGNTLYFHSDKVDLYGVERRSGRSIRPVLRSE